VTAFRTGRGLSWISAVHFPWAKHREPQGSLFGALGQSLFEPGRERPQPDDGGAPAAPGRGSVGEAFDAGEGAEHLAHALPLNADAATVDEADFSKALLDGGEDVFFGDRRDVSRLEAM